MSKHLRTEILFFLNKVLSTYVSFILEYDSAFKHLCLSVGSIISNFYFRILNEAFKYLL